MDSVVSTISNYAVNTEKDLTRQKKLYADRLIHFLVAEGSSFRKLKYTIGLSDLHSYRPEYIRQEIWARLTAYNITETIIRHTVIEKHDTKHDYKINFAVAAHICRVFLRLAMGMGQIDVMSLLQKELIPIPPIILYYVER